MARIDLSERFGEVLRRLRVEAGLTQEELAHRAEVTRNYIGMLESGQSNPTLNTMAMLAAALSTTVTKLVSAVERHA